MTDSLARRKKIVLVTHGFYPEISPRSFRATELAKEFASLGHDLTVITIDRGPETIRLCETLGIRYRIMKKPWFRPFPVLRWLPTFITRALNRSLLMLFEYPDIELMFKVASAIRKEESGADLLISFAVPYPVHWGVAWSWQRRLAKCWVADCGDPYIGNKSDSFRKLFYFKSVEKWFFRKPDYISIPIEGARRAYFDEFQNKLVVIPQGVDIQYYSKYRKPYQPGTVIRFAYAGSFIPKKRDPTRLLTFLLSLNLDFVFYIFTSTTGLVKEIESRSKGKVVIKELISREELISTLSTMNFLINVENSTQTQAPSKLIDYYLAGRPVVSVTSDQTDFSSVLLFLQGNYSDQMDLSELSEFDISIVARQFLNLADNYE